MLTKKQIKEIREHLEKAQNPVFFYDNDPDGLCSFLLLRRYLGRGKGVPIRSFPGLAIDYFRKIDELNADYVFILDKPVVSKEFFDAVKQINIPVVWIDHHEIDKKDIPKFVSYYNPIFNKGKTNEPVTYLCQKIAGRKEDLWFAVVGCVSDHYIPDFYPEFLKKYLDMGFKTDEPFGIVYNSQIGKISRILSFALKDSMTNVVRMMKYLIDVKSPYEVLDVNPKNKFMHERFNQIDRTYQKMIKKAKANADEDLLFFQYSSDLSISADISNQLSYLFPEKFILVMRILEATTSVSARGDDIRGKVLEAIKGLENATGGGHEKAVGAKLRTEDLEEFKERLRHIVKDSKI
jgi:single-stranded DNA-specific DHH superfamily exonuclease